MDPVLNAPKDCKASIMWTTTLLGNTELFGMCKLIQRSSSGIMRKSSKICFV